MKHIKPADMKFVSKRWGWESWIVNNEKYCGKLLFIKQGKFCSFHTHKIKDEVLFVKSGRLSFTYADEDSTDPKNIELSAGNAFHVTTNGFHQMHALEDTLIIEFSTQHFDEDSYRATKDLVVAKSLTV